MTATRIRRAFRSTPVQTADQTWDAIIDVIAPGGSPGRGDLEAISGVACSLIASEAWGDHPAVISGVGPQLRIYCLYGEAAILGEDASEDALSWSPTVGDWRMALPCPAEDLDWVGPALAQHTQRVTAVDLTRKLALADSREDGVKGRLEIDPQGFLRP